MRAIDGDALAELLYGVRRRLDPKAYKSEAELYIRDNMLLNLEEMVRSAPTIDPVKHGRWNRENDYNTCSVCGKSVHVFNDDGDKQNFTYCPNCGARMEEL